MQKKELREKIRQLLKQQTAAQAQAASQLITQHLKQFLLKQEGEEKKDTTARFHLFSYSSTILEPDLSTLHAHPQFKISYPLCRENHQMTFHEVHDVKTLNKGKYGILEPNPKQHPETAATECCILLCPCFALDKKGARLGKGGGYYDRWLEKHRTARMKVLGTAFHLQLVKQLPTNKHDQQMDYILTEQNIMPCH